MAFANAIGFLLFAGISLASATIAIYLTGRLLPSFAPAAGTQRRCGPIFADMQRRYEFRQGYLLSDVDTNDAFLDAEIDRSRAWEALSHAMSGLHDDLPQHLEALATRGEPFVLMAEFGDDLLSVSGRMEDDRLILTLGPAGTAEGRQTLDCASLAALQSRAEDMRYALDQGPLAMWKIDASGAVTWANAPYFALAEQLLTESGSALAWPLPQVFGDALTPPPAEGSLRRCRLGGEDEGGEDALWFEVSAHRQPDGNLMFAAMPVDRLIAAETALRRFVQTLSKTFAHLPVGLAVFDKKRELVMFNPALVSLSLLDVTFLSNRPGLVDFLDALRNNHRMPEPKDYRSWRDEIARLEQGARDGSYRELWTLSDGQTLRVSGRPHPDGAVAFLFEDITTEVSLTRKFRGDLDLYRAIIDDTPGALAVFSSDGDMVLSNPEYSKCWGDLAESQTLAEATRAWRSRCAPTGLWKDIRHFVRHGSDRKPWTEGIALRDGRRMICRVTPLTGGATAVRFSDQGFADSKSEPALRVPASAQADPRPLELAEEPAGFESIRGAAQRVKEASRS